MVALDEYLTPHSYIIILNSMFKLFRKKPKEKSPPELFDIDGNTIFEGDMVIAQRYELGKCKVLLEERQFFYVSLNSGQKITYIKMIDAITGHQKVQKILDKEVKD